MKIQVTKKAKHDPYVEGVLNLDGVKFDLVPNDDDGRTDINVPFTYGTRLSLRHVIKAGRAAAVFSECFKNCKIYSDRDDGVFHHVTLTLKQYGDLEKGKVPRKK